MARITSVHALATFVIAGWLGLALPGLARAQTIVAWGNNFYGQCNVPTLPPGLAYVEIAAEGGHCVARRSDGSAVAWGKNDNGQCNVTPLPAGLTYVEVSAGRYHTVARRSDGSAVGWGENSLGQCTIPALPFGLTYSQVSGGALHTALLRSNGSVIAFGSNGNGQCNVLALPAGLTYVEVAAGAYHTVARRSDGSVVAWGLNGDGECNVPPLPAGLTYVEVAAGFGFPSSHTVARRSDGSVVAWGDNQFGQCNIPAPPPGLLYVGVAAGGGYTAALQGLAGAAVSVGAGCGGAGMPGLSCNAPRIGQNLIFALTQGTPNASGSLFFSGVPAAPTILGFGCAVELDLAAFNAFTPVVAGPVGAWGSTVGVPMDQGLVGLQVALQIALFNTSGPFGLDLSNGVIVTVGY